MFVWQPQMIRFMQDASENSSYYRELAKMITPHLQANAHVCDAGCGLGYLSLELSGACTHVSAVDIAPQALAVLRTNTVRLNSGNINIIEGDFAKCPPEKPYDAMIFCFSGGAEEIIRIAGKQCAGKVIIIMRNWKKHRFSLAEKPMEHDTLPKISADLLKLGIQFKSKTVTLEMGQPFRSISDAVEFFRIYSRDETPITEGDILDRLIRQPSEVFPYYLPSEKQIGMIVLDSGDIPVAIDQM